MRTHKTSQGISTYASNTEVRLGLRDHSYNFLDPLEWLVEKVSAHFNVNPPTVRVGRSARRIRGHYKWSLTKHEIILNNLGFCIATVLHELAHHINKVQSLGKHHDHSFKYWHEQILIAWSKGLLGTKEKLECLDKAAKYWHTMPNTYVAHWHEGITTEELVGKIEAQVGK